VSAPVTVAELNAGWKAVFLDTLPPYGRTFAEDLAELECKLAKEGNLPPNIEYLLGPPALPRAMGDVVYFFDTRQSWLVILNVPELADFCYPVKEFELIADTVGAAFRQLEQLAADRGINMPDEDIPRVCAEWVRALGPRRILR
jgi:hypothetical protein